MSKSNENATTIANVSNIWMNRKKKKNKGKYSTIHALQI